MSMRFSVPSSPNRHSSTRSAYSENSAKLVPAPSQVARELGSVERLRRLGVRDLVAREACELGELAPPALDGRTSDPLVDVVGEELKRRPLAVLLAHEQQRYEAR